MSYRFRRLVAFISLESWASHAASCPIHLITLSRTPCDYTSPNYSELSFSAAYSTWLAVVMVAAVMAVVHMAACMAVPPPAWPPALPSRTFVLVVVLVLVLGDSAIGDANGALGRGRFWATAPPPSAPFRFPNPSCSRTTAGRQNPNFDRLVRQLQGCRGASCTPTYNLI